MRLGKFLGWSKTRRLVLQLVLGRGKNLSPYLALGMLASYLRKVQADGALASYKIGKLFPAGLRADPAARVFRKIAAQDQAPVCLFSSYVWNHDTNIEVAAAVKAANPDSVLIFGGPHVPKYSGETERFLADNPFIDIAVIGEGEIALAEILSTLEETPSSKLDALASVHGLVFRAGSEVIRTPDRERLKDITVLPSPYLEGELGDWFTGFPLTVLETNRGCPYGCTYCDWGSATLSKVTKFSPERVIAEVEFMAQRESEAIFIADANFGMLEQDIEIARGIVDIKKQYGYPERIITNFAKNGGRRLMSVIKILQEGGLLPIGIIALQTTDSIVLKAIARDNIKTESYEKMMAYFNSENIPMASDLMLGLPGQTVESFVNDLQFCFDWKVSAWANYTSMMPNAPMAEPSYREQYGLTVDEDDIIQSSTSFSASDMAYMKSLYITYLFHVKFSVLKYILYYFQIEHGVPAIEFLRRWLDEASATGGSLPISHKVVKEIFDSDKHTDWAMLSWNKNADFLFNNAELYYVEILDFAAREFSLDISQSERDTLVTVQQAVMPRAGRRYPYTTEVSHDFHAYIEQVKSVASVQQLDDQFLPLHAFAPSEVTIDGEAEIIESNEFLKAGVHANAWELPSQIRFY